MIHVPPVVVVATPSAGAQAPLEGTVTLRMASGGRGAPATRDIVYTTRQGKLRVVMTTPMGEVTLVSVPDEHKAYVLIDAQRMYMEVPVPGAQRRPVPDGTVTVKKTGRQETVAGLTCEHREIRVTTDSTTRRLDVCLTTALGRYVNPLDALGGMTGTRSPSWQRALGTDGGFPLKVTMDDGTVAMEVMHIERRRVSDAQFSVPADYVLMQPPRKPGR